MSSVQATTLRLPKRALGEHDLRSSRLTPSVKNASNVVKEGCFRTDLQHLRGCQNMETVGIDCDEIMKNRVRTLVSDVHAGDQWKFCGQ